MVNVISDLLCNRSHAPCPICEGNTKFMGGAKDDNVTYWCEVCGSLITYDIDRTMPNIKTPEALIKLVHPKKPVDHIETAFTISKDKFKKNDDD